MDNQTKTLMETMERNRRETENYRNLLKCYKFCADNISDESTQKKCLKDCNLYGNYLPVQAKYTQARPNLESIDKNFR